MLLDNTLIKAALLGAAFLLSVSGCTTVDPSGNPAHIIAWAAKQDFWVSNIRAGTFRLASFSRGAMVTGDTMVVYIEGDGAPWVTPYHPPRDPTPQKPVSLTLAAVDPAQKVVYLGRPCQYLDAEALRNCDSAYWIERRFAPEVIAAYDDALTQLKASLGVRQIRLVGFSGGGVIAVLVAARRNDVESLITVAAPLAVSEWVVWHNASPLIGSLDPAELGENVHLPPSVHFVGNRDKIVPVSVVEKFTRRKGGHMETILDFDHDCCWSRDWAKLLGRVLTREVAK
ncbi:MAG: hypothetical protein A3H42_03355 [Deltaproteobacteria bacterium RIFCSPLOWO2_02_FULL_46_8]|nr:MAG: hypothetical protein A3H42_03355 [Deltaproteobacteria bacterium RIFCSPLOWO2_02_FULL_46_8]